MYSDYKKKIISFYERDRRMPSYQEIMKLVGFKSKNAAYKLVAKLVEDGLIEKDSQGKLLPSSQFFDLPLLGLVQAGNPTDVEAGSYDTLSLESYLVNDRGKTFCLEVNGDSMIDAHIEEGDIVVAARTESAKNGDIVVAEVDGEFTLKYYKNEKGKQWLMPANKNYKPIYPRQNLRIVAVVKGVVRKY
jgi:SOS regulatory protein LexA